MKKSKLRQIIKEEIQKLIEKELKLPSNFNDNDLLDFEHHGNVRNWKNVRTKKADGILVIQYKGDKEMDKYLFKFKDYNEKN